MTLSRSSQCIALIDYDPEKMSPSESPHLELKMAEGNLLRCYTRAVEEDGYTMAEVCIHINEEGGREGGREGGGEGGREVGRRCLNV